MKKFFEFIGICVLIWFLFSFIEINIKNKPNQQGEISKINCFSIFMEVIE